MNQPRDPGRSEPLLVPVLEYAGDCGYPALTLPDATHIGAGRDAWGAWAATADGVQLARALGMLAVRKHRPAEEDSLSGPFV